MFIEHHQLHLMTVEAVRAQLLKKSDPHSTRKLGTQNPRDLESVTALENITAGVLPLISVEAGTDRDQE